ncbi:MAG: metallophosphatase family protein [Firmicutes bacterium]|nr:metallophosphatase family protein [Bacillota bacterium]
MRLAVIADIHGNLAALEAVLADIRRQGADAVVCLGDVAFKGPQPAECVDRLRQLGIPCVLGNTDRWLAGGLPEAVAARPGMAEMAEWCRQQLGPERLRWLEGLPFAHTVDLGGLTVRAVHGSPRSEDEFTFPWLTEEELMPLLEGVAEAAVCVGHHHLPMVRRAMGKWLFGPGSVGMPGDGDTRAAYGLLVTTPGGGMEARLVRVPYDLEATLAVAAQRQMPGQAAYAEALRAGRLA